MFIVGLWGISFFMLVILVNVSTCKEASMFRHVVCNLLEEIRYVWLARIEKLLFIP